MIPETISHYRIRERIGAGGMGEVFRARDARLERDVAIKILPQELASPERLERFEREAKAVAALSHPNILAIHDFGRDPDSELVYAVMELLEGETLRNRLGSHALSSSQAVVFAQQIVRGLSAAHARSIVHRDLKPENIFVSTENAIKILDFGLAKVAQVESVESGEEAPTQNRTAAGTVMGTAGYMAPEQVRGREVDHRADIFSLGAVLYEMLCGERAFYRDSAVETMHAVLESSPTELARHDVVVAPALERIVWRCLEKAPEDRFQSTRDLLFALENYTDTTSSPAPAPEPSRALASIAVLPFADMSSAKDQDYFCEGMAEEILNALTKIDGLRVAARTSAFRFKGKSEDIRSIGDALKVDCLLEGSVRTAGRRLRVTAQLVNVEDGYQLWSERYDRDLEDVFAVQDEITARIVEALEERLGVRVVAPRRQPHPSNVLAYQAYLRGRQHWYRRTDEHLARAITLFEEAIAIDPDYALAFAGLADCHTWLGYNGSLEPKVAASRARETFERALELDDGLAEAYTARGLVRFMYDWQWKEAKEDFRKALELEPAESHASGWYANLLFQQGEREQSFRVLDDALALDPLSPFLIYWKGVLLYMNGAYDESLAQFDGLLELTSNFEVVHVQRALAYSFQSKHDEACTAAERASDTIPLALAILSLVQARAGRRDEAKQSLANASKTAGTMWSVVAAWVRAALGDYDEAFGLLERAVLERSPYLIYINNRMFDDLRADPRFEDVKRSVNIST